MANTSAVYARIDTNLKENAESILSQLGISPFSAIRMLYGQIVLTKGVESLKSGRIYTADEVDAQLAREFGIWAIPIPLSIPQKAM